MDKGSLDSMLVKPSGEALEDDTGDTWLRSSPVAVLLAEVARVSDAAGPSSSCRSGGEQPRAALVRH